MLSHGHTIQPQRRVPVHAVEGEAEDPSDVLLRGLQRILIPADSPILIRPVSHIPGMWDEDILRLRQRHMVISSAQSLVVRISQKLPFPTQFAPRSHLCPSVPRPSRHPCKFESSTLTPPSSFTFIYSGFPPFGRSPLPFGRLPLTFSINTFVPHRPNLYHRYSP